MFVIERISGVFAPVPYEVQGLISRLIVFCVLAVVDCQEMRDLSVGGVRDLFLVHRWGVLDDDGPSSR